MRLRRRAPVVSQGRRRRQNEGTVPASPSFAYRSRRSDQESNLGRGIPREPAPDKPRSLGRFLAQRFGLVILLVALVVSLVNVLSLSSDARIVTLTDSGSTGSSPFLQDKSVYQAAADRLLAGSVWNHNKLTVDTAGISRHLLKQFPELADVSVTLPLISKHPTVYVQTAKAALILSASNGPYVIDTTGKALMNADNLPSADRHGLPVVTDKSGLTVKLNRQALTSGDASFITIVKAELAARHVDISSMDLPPATSELDVHIDGQPYFVKFNLETGTARQQAGTLLATQAALKRQNVTPARYIDVRVDGRAYYR